MNFRITFSPFEVLSTAQIQTVATVLDSQNLVLWTEPIIIDIREGLTNADIQTTLTQRTSGFAARVNALRHARTFRGVVPAAIEVR